MSTIQATMMNTISDMPDSLVEKLVDIAISFKNSVGESAIETKGYNTKRHLGLFSNTKAYADNFDIINGLDDEILNDFNVS